MVPSQSLRLLVTGLVFAGSGSLFAISPLGKLSGSHINPSVSLAFFARGKMHGEDLAGYLGGQILGGVLGAWLLVATMVWLGAPISGTSLNPARSFGPSLVNWFWPFQWLYWIAPPAGALTAVLIFHCLRADRPLLTAKLFHVPHYRCIFKNVHVPHVPVNG